MSTLTDRYVWGVLRGVPERQRADLDPEIRAMIADAIEARTAAGVEPAAAEREALLELGDPDRLASGYTDRPLYLIGPRFFLDWRRLLTILVPIVVTALAFAVVLGDTIAGTGLPETILHAVSASVSVGIQLVFWVTVGFAVLERTDARRTVSSAWSLDQLPELPSGSRVSPAEVVAGIVANLFLIAALVWQQAETPVTVEGQRFALFDPALWSLWMPWFLAVAALEIALMVTLYLAGRWTLPIAAANAALDAAFVVPAIWLLQERRLFNPALVDALESVAGGAWFAPTAAVIGVMLAVVVGWDAIDGFLKARRAAGHGTLIAASTLNASR